MRTLVLSALCVVALSSTAHANGVNVSNNFGNSCSQNQSTGQAVSFGTKFNSQSNEAEVSATYTIEIGRKKANKIDCTSMYNNSVRMENMLLRKMEIELAILERKLANSQNNDNAGLNDDW